jgi:putative CocE/NonD family hydrolase
LRLVEGSGDTAPLLSAPHADLRTSAFVLGASQPTDLRNEERTGLTWTSPALHGDLEVSGPVSLRLFASATAPDFDWSVRLADVWPDGRSEWITDGYLRASLRHVDSNLSLRSRSGAIVRPWLTFDRPEAVPIAEPVEYDIDLVGTSNVFRAGHRLRVDVLPVADAEVDSARTGGAGVVTVLHDAAHPSTLMLPVIPSRCQASQPLAPDTPSVRCVRSYEAALG